MATKKMVHRFLIANSLSLLVGAYSAQEIPPQKELTAEEELESIIENSEQEKKLTEFSLGPRQRKLLEAKKSHLSETKKQDKVSLKLSGRRRENKKKSKVENDFLIPEKSIIKKLKKRSL